MRFTLMLLCVSLCAPTLFAAKRSHCNDTEGRGLSVADVDEILFKNVNKTMTLPTIADLAHRQALTHVGSMKNPLARKFRYHELVARLRSRIIELSREKEKQGEDLWWWLFHEQNFVLGAKLYFGARGYFVYFSPAGVVYKGELKVTPENYLRVFEQVFPSYLSPTGEITEIQKDSLLTSYQVISD